MRHILFASLLTAGLMGCATTAAEKGPDGIMAFEKDPRLGEEVSKICFNSTIDGFSNNTDNTVVLQKGVSDYHIVEVSGVCRDLEYAQSIAIDSSLSCVRRGDYLLVSTSAFTLNDPSGIGPDRCYIKKIHKWDKSADEDMKDAS